MRYLGMYIFSNMNELPWNVILIDIDEENSFCEVSYVVKSGK